MSKIKLIRVTTVPISLEKLLGSQLKFMNNYFNVKAVSSEEQALKKYGEKEGVETYCVNMTRKISPLADLRSLKEMYFYLRREKPFIVHTHTPKAGIIGMLAAWLARVPVRLHTVAGLPLLEKTGFTRKVLNTVESLTYKFATKVYPNSFGLHKIILDAKFTSPEKLKVIGNGSSNGIDTTYYDGNNIPEEIRSELKSKLGISEHDFVFVFVGRLVGDKGINELIASFVKLKEKHKALKLLLVGPLEEDLDPLHENTINTILNEADIISAGYQSDVRPYFSIANALVFPSYREGFPNVVLQAGAMGLPAIVSDINGCNEIVLNEENGLIIPVKNVDILYSAMDKIYLDKEFYEKCKSKARNRIVEKYEQNVLWTELLKEYKQFTDV